MLCPLVFVNARNTECIEEKCPWWDSIEKSCVLLAILRKSAIARREP